MVPSPISPFLKKNRYFLANSEFRSFSRAFNSVFNIINFNYEYRSLDEGDPSFGIVPPL